MRNTHCIACIAAPMLAVAIVGCGKNETATDKPAPSTTAPAKVAVVNSQRKSLRRIVVHPGTIQADEEATLFARVSGYVSKVHVDIGKRVEGPRFDRAGNETTPGQLLADIAVPDLVEEANQKRALKRQTEAEVEQATKSLAAAEAHIATVEAAVVEAKSLYTRWDSELKRIEKLVANGSIEVQTRDETNHQLRAAGARVQSAEATVLKAKADRDKAKSDIAAATAKVAVAEADARRVEAMVAYAKIRAPFDGVITKRKVNTGDFVQPLGGKGDLLFTVTRLDPVRIVIAVPEADAALVQEKAPVKLRIPALSGPGIDAVITRTSWALDPSARTLRAEIEHPNKDGKLRPGHYVYAQITTQLPEAWVLPSAAVVKQGDAMVCFRVEGNKAVRTLVQVGATDGDFLQVLKWQKPGTPSSWEDWSEKVVVAAKAAGLSDGQAVQVESPGK